MIRYSVALGLLAVCVFFASDKDFRWISALLLRLPESHTLLLTPEELSRYTGTPDSPGLYLAVLGQVFDVSRGRRHYSPGGSYHVFAGKDGSRAFVTGDFTETGLVDDLSGLSPLEVLVINDWLSFYKKEYPFVGKLIGRFYTNNGEPTEALKQAETSIYEGQKLKAKTQLDNLRFPPCNSEWSAASGGRVWCTTNSGGIQRNWAGVPRKLYSPGSRGFHCVCVQVVNDISSQNNRGELDNPNLQVYDNCPPLEESCILKG
ncbi:neuferricin [Erpetoichthys calabaricus]|uniref:Neuferricin n=1 Tax=Erpetoichthys calabaricus TaxID=27687 RepID=A0A8C4THW8_ERPCA|nr:neuferricin [Erpetoichthys calabaricus]